MSDLAERLKPYQTEHLMLLVGTNPLPNAVAAKLLIGARTQVAFLVTPETHSIAMHLARTLGISASYLQVNDSDPDSVYGTVRQWAEGKHSIGLNYTGGTKVMAVKAVQAVRDVTPNTVFSYLNPRLLTLQIERGPARHTETVGNAVLFSLKDLFDLHQIDSKQKSATATPAETILSEVLVKICSDRQSRTEWYDWRRKKSDGWKHFPPVDHPRLGELGKALVSVCQGQTLTVAALAAELGTLDVTNWLKGFWLEAYTLNALKRAISLEFNDMARDLHCVSRLSADRCKADFQIDLAAMRGYQLFAFSCIDSDQRPACKEHLLEVLARARQMGGDEARAALICAIPDTDELQCEVEKPWDAAGKIKVFGAAQLLNLADHLREWFRKV
jgi:hypothetical protein